MQLPELKLTLRAQHVNNNREAFILFNDQNAVYLPPNKGQDIETMKLTVRPEWLVPGQNKIQICYDDQVKNDKDPGFAIYFLAIDSQ